VEHNRRLCGLIVDSASEVIKIPAADVEPSAAVFQEGGLNAVTGLGKYKGRLIVLVDMAKLLQFSGLKQDATAGNVTERAAAGATQRASAPGR